MSVDDQVKKMTLDINLSEIQQLQVRKTLVEQEKNRESFKPQKDQAERPSREEMETKMSDEKKASEEKFKKILTPEQFAKWSKKNRMVKNKNQKKGLKPKRKVKKRVLRIFLMRFFYLITIYSVLLISINSI